MPKQRGGAELSHKPPMLRQAPNHAPLPKMSNPDTKASIPYQKNSAQLPIQERKKGPKLGNLEMKLGHVQDELRKLKEELVSTNIIIPPTAEHNKNEEEKMNGGLPETKLKQMEGVLKGYEVENKELKKRLKETVTEAAETRKREEKMAMRLERVNEELSEARAHVGRLEEQLAVSNSRKSSLEEEMGRLRIQIEQWRKAADVAVSALADQEGIGSRRNSSGLGIGDLWKKKTQS